MQTETTMGCHYTLTKMAEIAKTNKRRVWSNWDLRRRSKGRKFCVKVSMCLPRDPESSLPVI